MKSFIRRICTLSFLVPMGMIVVGIAYLIGCFELNFGTLSLPAEGFMPFIVAILFLTGSGWLAVDAFVRANKLHAVSPKTERIEIINVLLLVGVLFAYVILLPVLGFVFSSVPLLISSARIMGARWRSALILAMCVTIICYILFIFGLKIPFPSYFSV